MKREIKFRAWIVEDEVMVAWDEIVASDLQGSTIFIESLTDNQYSYMQYTGLKDKNGVEIYEGDIVNRIFPNSGTIEMRVVIYHKDGYRLEETGKFKGLSLLFSAIEDIEIIGNIHENGELLSVSND